MHVATLGVVGVVALLIIGVSLLGGALWLPEPRSVEAPPGSNTGSGLWFTP